MNTASLTLSFLDLHRRTLGDEDHSSVADEHKDNYDDEGSESEGKDNLSAAEEHVEDKEEHGQHQQNEVVDDEAIDDEAIDDEDGGEYQGEDVKATPITNNLSCHHQRAMELTDEDAEDAFQPPGISVVASNSSQKSRNQGRLSKSAASSKTSKSQGQGRRSRHAGAEDGSLVGGMILAVPHEKSATAGKRAPPRPKGRRPTGGNIINDTASVSSRIRSRGAGQDFVSIH